LALDWLEEPRVFDTLPRDLPSSRPNRRRRVERPQARAARRVRRVALLVVLSAVFLVAIALTAFGSTTTPTSAIVPPKSLATAAQTRPTTEIVAQRGQVRLQLPISQSRLTAIGYSMPRKTRCHQLRFISCCQLNRRGRLVFQPWMHWPDSPSRQSPGQSPRQ
jgi:hypothetical protein